VIKIIIIIDDRIKRYKVIQLGDQRIVNKTMRKEFNVKNVSPASYELAHKCTGYEFGGTSPFCIKANIPIYAEHTIFEMDSIFINGGRRGVSLKISPDLLHHIGVKAIEVSK